MHPKYWDHPYNNLNTNQSSLKYKIEYERMCSTKTWFLYVCFCLNIFNVNKFTHKLNVKVVGPFQKKTPPSNVTMIQNPLRK